MLDNDLIEVIAASLVEIIVAEVEMLLAFFVNSVEFEVDCISNWNSFQEHSLIVKGVDKVVPQKLGAPRKLLIRRQISLHTEVIHCHKKVGQTG